MNKYPTAKVILGYTLLGGFMGGLVFILGILLRLAPSVTSDLLSGGLSEISFDKLIDWLLTTVGFASFSIIFAVPIGALPAFLAGFIIALFEIRLYGFEEIIKCFLIGIFASWLFLWMWLGITNGIAFWFGIIGGVSSVILAFLFLPRE